MPIQDGLHFKLLPDLLRLNAFTLVTEHRAASFHGEFGQLRQAVDERFGHAVRQILDIRITARVDKRQDRDGFDLCQVRRAMAGEPITEANDGKQQNCQPGSDDDPVLFDTTGYVLGAGSRARCDGLRPGIFDYRIRARGWRAVLSYRIVPVWSR